MKKKLLAALTAIALASIAVPAYAQTGSLWDEEFARTQNELSAERAQAKFPLTNKEGPWMVKVASFEGQNAFEHANDLCMELRNRWKIDAYVCDFKPDTKRQLSDEKKREEFEAEYKKRFEMKPKIWVELNKGEKNFAVFAGNFKDDEGAPEKAATKMLTTIRQLQPNAVPQSVWDKIRFKKAEGQQGKGEASPFKSAMLVWNPMYPRRKISPLTKKEAELLLSMNDDGPNTPYSAYQIKGNYTMMVALFRGASLFYVKGMKESKDGPAISNKQVQDKIKSFENSDNSPLKKAAENAVGLAHELRKNGYDAYVFHGLYGSMVCIGSYDRLDDPRIKAHIAEYSKVRIVDNETLKPELITTPRKPNPNEMSAN